MIQNYATILQSDGLTEAERREYSQRIGEAAGRLSALVSNILQLNRLENQKIHPSTAPFNLSEALSRCILNYDALLEEKSIDLQDDLDQDLILTGDERGWIWYGTISCPMRSSLPQREAASPSVWPVTAALLPSP